MRRATTRPIVRLLSLAALFFAAAPLAHAAADTCNLLTTAEISSATGDPVTTTSPGPSNCIWRGKESGIYLTIRDGSAWKTGKAALTGTGHATPVSGVGDDAFFAAMGNQPWLYALKGSHFIIIHVNVTKLSADQAESALKTLANEALSRL
jgi:hypothetical protein